MCRRRAETGRSAWGFHLNVYSVDSQTFCTNTDGPQTMNPSDLGDPLTFPLAPP